MAVSVGYRPKRRIRSWPVRACVVRLAALALPLGSLCQCGQGKDRLQRTGAGEMGEGGNVKREKRIFLVQIDFEDVTLCRPVA